MEKTIMLKMLPSKDISIALNEDNEIAIGKANRTIMADEIYTLLGYERGDTYVVKSVNEQGLDIPVLQFFTDLFRDITDRLNRLSETQNDDEDESVEGEHEISEGNMYSYNLMNYDDEDLPF